MYRRLLRYLGPYKWFMAGTIASSILAAAFDAFSFSLLIPFLNALFEEDALLDTSGKIGRVLDAIIGPLIDPADKMGSLQGIIVVILAATTLKNLFAWFGGQLGARLQEYVTRDLRSATYKHMQRLPLSFFTRTKQGQILSRVLVDAESTKMLITTLVTNTLQNVFVIVAYLFVLFSISWKLALYALVIAPALMGALQPLLKRLRKGYRRLRNDYGEMTSVLTEVTSGIRLVKSFGAEAYEERRWDEASARYTNGMVRVTKVSFMAQPITETIGVIITVGLLWVGARQVLVEGVMQGGELIAFLAVVTRLLSPLKQVTQIPTSAQGALAAAERLFDVLDQPTERMLDRGTRTVDGFRDRVAFEDVSFSYGDEPVLQDVSVEARRGQVVALVGPSGAGKSTLVDLIPRFHEPTAGRILLDGVDLRDIRLESLRALMGIVSQDTVLFNDTVRHNIAYGASGKYDDARVIEAATMANAHGFISELPDGYDTILGERGTRLSGGQRQRIAIARALLVDPPILILDEATSALDTESERLVQEAIDRLLAGRTVFVIAHRLSTVVHADQILVLDRGHVVERGTHRELLERRGAYWRLYNLQFRNDRRPEPDLEEASEPASPEPVPER
jgi:subfamily B ATP-binding cassette protein MsbA